MDETGLKNPFAGFNASLMDIDEIIQYWTPTGIDLTGTIPVFLMGGRGTGKTMVLKFISNEVQVKKYISEHENGIDFFKDVPYIGVYYRFDGPSLSSFTERHANHVVWETIFKHYFEIVIGQKYISMLLNLKEKNILDLNKFNEQDIVTEILKLIDPEQYNKIKNHTLESIIMVLQKMADEVFQFINNAALSNNPEFDYKPIISSGKLIFNIPKIIVSTIPEFKDKNIIILLDEYENLLFQQQKIVNTLIKHTQSPVTFRIGARLNGLKTYDTLNEGEFLMEDADYRKILFEDVISSHEKKYKNYLKEISQKRLKNIPDFNERGLIDIESLLGNLKLIDEAQNVVFNGDYKKEIFHLEKYIQKKHITEIFKELYNRNVSKYEIGKIIPKLIYPENPLVEMLNLLLIRRDYEINEIIKMFNLYRSNNRGTEEYNKYKQLYQKNELGLLFQLIRIYRPKQKMYAGFDVFSMLSSGIVRNYLELCYQSFNISLFSEQKDLLNNGQISIKNQTLGAEIRAEKFFDTIERIPKYGNIIKSLVSSLGAIFYAWHKDPRLREPEPTYFYVDKTLLSDEAKNVLDTAVQWSILQQKKAMKGKSSHARHLDVYVLNHILSPYFTISYRIRGRIPQFSKIDMENLMFGDEDDKEKTIKKLGRWTKIEQNQLQLFDFN